MDLFSAVAALDMTTQPHVHVADTAARRAPSGATLPFFALTFGITWALQLPAVLALLGVIAGPPERYLLLVGLGAFGPALAALLVARRGAGGAGVGALLQPLLRLRVGAGWYLVALLLPGALLVAGMAVHRLATGSDAGPFLYPPRDAPRIAAAVVFSIGEEIGFRGLALPRLQRRYGPLRASLVLGVAWAFWHIPMFLLAGITPPTFALLVPFFMAGSVVITWIYNRARGSLLIAMLAHVGAHLNNAQQALPANTTPAMIHTVAYVAFALALIAFDRTLGRADPGSAP
jgi:uncharacterized protein